MAIITDDIAKDVLTIVIIVITLVYAYYHWAFSYWRRKGVQHTPTSIPFGSAASILRRKTTFGPLLQEVYEKYKSEGHRYVGFYLFSKPGLVFLDINLIKTVLARDFHHFTDHGNYVNEESEPLTGHLFALKGKKWKNMRVKLTPTFTSGKMKMMFHTLVECSIGLKEVMDNTVKNGEAADIKDIVARYTTDVIGSCAFGIDCNSLKNPDSDFRKFGKRIFEVTKFQGFVRFLALVSPDIVATLRLQFFSKDISDFIMNVVRGTVRYREENHIKRNDFMHLLIQLKNNVQLKEDEDVEHLKNEDSTGSVGLTTEEIAAQVFVFFIAGFETSSTTLSFCFFELAVNPDIQAKLRSEIQEVLQKHDGNITYDAIMAMSYMDKCIQETLRKYPPLPVLIRECTEDYTIPESDVVIEKGTQTFIPVLGVHRDPEFYPDPDKFDPERFSAENKAAREHFAWLPFGEGPRACIGLRFGLMQTKVALAVLLKDYEFTLNNRTENPLVIGTETIIMSARGGVWLNVKKIKS